MHFFCFTDLKTMKKESCKFGLDGSPRGDNLFIWVIHYILEWYALVIV